MTQGQDGPRELTVRLYAAMDTGDLGTVAALLAPEFVLHVPGANPLAGDHVGMAGFAQFMSTLTGIAPAGARTEVLDVMGGRDHAAVYGISRAERPGREPLVNHTVHLVSVAGGRVTEVTFLNVDQGAVDAFWS